MVLLEDFRLIIDVLHHVVEFIDSVDGESETLPKIRYISTRTVLTEMDTREIMRIYRNRRRFGVLEV